MPKYRPRSHQIADLSLAHIRQLLAQVNYTAIEIVRDYGHDLLVQTCNDDREMESGFVLFQLKSTDRPKMIEGGLSWAVRIEKRDLLLWLGETNPFFLIFFDASAIPPVAYWLNVHDALRKLGRIRISDRKTVTLRVPVKNRVTPRFLRWIRDYKLGIMRQIWENVDYGIESTPYEDEIEPLDIRPSG